MGLNLNQFKRIFNLHHDDIDILMSVQTNADVSHEWPVIDDSKSLLMPNVNDIELVVIYGTPSDAQMRELIHQNENLKHILIYDPYSYMCKQRINNIAWHEFANTIDIRWILSTGAARILQRIEDYFMENIDRFIRSAQCPHALVQGYEKLDGAKEKFSNFSRSFKMATENIFGKCKFSKEDSYYGIKNVVMNLQNIESCLLISDFKNMHQGMPIAVVAPGPSLETSIHTLKAVSSNVIIVACEAAVKVLEQNGLRADYICILERCVENIDMLNGLDLKQTHLVLTPLVHPEAMNLNVLSKIVAFRDVGASRWFYPSENFMFMGQTVSQMALAVAAYLGGTESPIYLFGVDCAYDPVSRKSHHVATHQLAHIQAEQGSKLGTVNVLKNYVVPGYEMQDVETNNLWLADSVIISNMIHDLHLNVTRVSKSAYGFHIEGVRRIDPDQMRISTQMGQKNMSSSAHFQKRAHSRKTPILAHMEQGKHSLVQLQNQCARVLSEITDFYYEHFPIYRENQDLYESFFASLAERRTSMLSLVQTDYFGLIHPILQGDYAMLAYTERCEAASQMEPYAKIEARLKLYRTWFSELLCWCVRIEKLLENVSCMSVAQSGSLEMSRKHDQYVVQ